MNYADAITRLSEIRTVDDGEQLVRDYADGIADGSIAHAYADLGWLTGEIAQEDRIRAFELMPELTHPVLGRRVDWTPRELIEAGFKFAADGLDLPLDKDRLDAARRELFGDG